MKKEKSSIIILSCSESSGDESEKAKPKTDKEELRQYLQKSDQEDETTQKTSPKKSKKLVKKRKTSSHTNVDQVKSSEEIIKPKKPIQKDSSQKYLLKGDDFKRFQKRQKNLAPHRVIIPKEKITNTWLNTMVKRFISVLSTLKTLLLTKIRIVETSISQRKRKLQTKMVNLLTKFPLIQIIGLLNF